MAREPVVQVRSGKAENLVEVFGALRPGDTILLRGTDEVQPGAPVIRTRGGGQSAPTLMLHAPPGVVESSRLFPGGPPGGDDYAGDF
jgi:hypothetical protein